MNKKPVSYMQTDPRWKDKPYRVPGENATIGGSGCGPTAAAMLIETITGKRFTPVNACNWSVEHGYKALNQGTYYSYFTPQFAHFGLSCKMLSWTNTYGKPAHANHDKVVQALKKGCYAIALMGKGHWTSSGHFVVLWWQDGKVRINDPASTKDSRVNGDIQTFRSQVKYYWIIDPSVTVPIPGQETEHKDIDNEKEEEDMTKEQFRALYEEMRKELQDNDNSEWSEEARQWAIGHGLIAGNGNGPDGKPNYMWEDILTREQAIMLFYRFAVLAGLV